MLPVGSSAARAPYSPFLLLLCYLLLSPSTPRDGRCHGECGKFDVPNFTEYTTGAVREVRNRFPSSCSIIRYTVRKRSPLSSPLLLHVLRTYRPHPPSLLCASQLACHTDDHIFDSLRDHIRNSKHVLSYVFLTQESTAVVPDPYSSTLVYIRTAVGHTNPHFKSHRQRSVALLRRPMLFTSLLLGIFNSLVSPRCSTHRRLARWTLNHAPARTLWRPWLVPRNACSNPRTRSFRRSSKCRS